MEYKYWFEHKFTINEMKLIAAILQASPIKEAQEIGEIFQSSAEFWEEGGY